MVVMHDCISTNCVLKYSRAKAGEPTGEPRRRKSSSDFGGEWWAEDIDVV